MVQALAQADPDEHVSCLRLRRGVVAELERQHDVLQRGERRQELERLEHESDRAAAQLDSGVVGLGYVEPVDRADLDAVERRVRAAGRPDFTIERVGDNPALYVVMAIEPVERNTGVLGLDVGSGTTRKTAAETAARNNEMVLSGHIRLDYEHRRVPGFLMFLPVYQKGLPLTTPAERLAAVQGWVYAPIRIDQLMAGIADVAGGQIDFEVFEGNARDGARGFPANVNVAAALSLAGIGPDRTRLEIWADPGLERNLHRIVVEANSAGFEMQIENVPSEDNPRTGKLTPLSVIVALQSLTATLRVGS